MTTNFTTNTTTTTRSIGEPFRTEWLKELYNDDDDDEDNDYEDSNKENLEPLLMNDQSTLNSTIGTIPLHQRSFSIGCSGGGNGNGKGVLKVKPRVQPREGGGAKGPFAYGILANLRRKSEVNSTSQHQPQQRYPPSSSLPTSENTIFKARKVPPRVKAAYFQVYKSEKPLTIPIGLNITDHLKEKRARSNSRKVKEDLYEYLEEIRAKAQVMIIDDATDGELDKTSQLIGYFKKFTGKEINNIMKPRDNTFIHSHLGKRYLNR